MLNAEAVIIYNESFHEPTIFKYPLARLGFDEGRGVIKNVWELLDNIYRDCNVVDGSEWIASQKLRSMSVGDMVILQDNVYCVMNAGFIKLI